MTCATDDCDHPATSSICPECRGKLRRTLLDIPSLWHDLLITLTRQRGVDYTNGTTSAGRETPLPIHLAAMLARTNLADTIAAWTREVERLTHRTCPHPFVPARANWILEPANFDTLTRSDLAGHAVNELVHGVVRDVRTVIDTPPQRVYRGTCDGHGSIDSPNRDPDRGLSPCGQDLYVHIRRDEPHWNCPTCGLTYNENDRWAYITSHYHGMFVTIVEASSILNVSRKTLQQQINRLRIVQHGQANVTTIAGARKAWLYSFDDLKAITEQRLTA
jgi:hypothetical protein